ncbi:hypothetical protein ACS0TY_026737 [Phlomoides rotata]
MFSNNTLVIALTWLLFVACLVTCSSAAKKNPTDRVVHPQGGCLYYLWDYTKSLITCAIV